MPVMAAHRAGSLFMTGNSESGFPELLGFLVTRVVVIRARRPRNADAGRDDVDNRRQPGLRRGFDRCDDLLRLPTTAPVEQNANNRALQAGGG